MSFRLFIDNLEHNISIKYPTTWEKVVAKMDTIVTFLSPLEHKLDIFRENLTVMMHDRFIQPKNLKTFIEIHIEQLKDGVLDFQLIKKKKIKISNLSAYSVVYMGKRRDFDVKIMQNYVVKDNKIYLLTYLAETDKYDLYLKIIKKMIKSFSFL